MDINWDLAKEITLWSYEDLIKKLQSVLRYRFVQETYNHSMAEAVTYVRQMGMAYGWQDLSHVDHLAAFFTALGDYSITSYADLVERVASRSKYCDFLEETNFGFSALIDLLNYLFRWALPFPVPLRELIDLNDAPQQSYYETLKRLKLSSNLDLLEHGRTVTGRRELTNVSDIPADFLLRLVQRSDVGRLAYVRGKTIMLLDGAGYGTLAQIASADPARMETDLDRYLRQQGKCFADYKSVIILHFLIGGAQLVPKVVEG